MAGSHSGFWDIQPYNFQRGRVVIFDDNVNLREHFGWQGLTHDDDIADLSTTEINEQGLNIVFDGRPYND